ncbi:MAG TPA: AI-2E family transporter [Longimicrobiaceae bacterium]|nr:AI-2E family transporter [Longimicrobiaceae bacterium]
MAEPKERHPDPSGEPDTPPGAAAAPPEPGGAVYLRPEHLYKTAGLLFLLALLYRFFQEISYGLLLLFAAAIVAVLLNSLVSRLPLERKWVTAALGLLIFGGIATVLWVGIPALVSQVRNIVGRVPEFSALLQQTERWVQANTGLNVTLVGPEVQEYFRDAFLSTSGDGGGFLGRATGLLEILFVPLLILFGGLFAVAKPNERLLTPVLRAVPRDRRAAYRRMLELLGVRLVGWLKGTLIAMVAVGALSTLAYWLIGVPNALLLGLFAGVTEFIPLVGPWVGGGTATAVAFLEEPRLALWTALAALAIQQIESNVITPWAMSQAAELHPFVTLFALVFFGSVFGFLGILLAIPLTLFFWTVVEVLWVERAIDTDEDRIDPVVEE